MRISCTEAREFAEGAHIANNANSTKLWAAVLASLPTQAAMFRLSRQNRNLRIQSSTKSDLLSLQVELKIVMHTYRIIQHFL